MDNEELPWDEDTEIDPELWLQALLAMTATKESKDNLVREMAQNTGQPPEHIELIIDATIQFMIEKTRSN